jgi:hypothetical protein
MVLGRKPTRTPHSGGLWRPTRRRVTGPGESYSDAKLTDLSRTLVDCPKTESANIYDRCKAAWAGVRLAGSPLPATISVLGLGPASAASR